MGEKFGSIHIKGIPVQAVVPLAEGRTVCQALPGWTSVLDPALQWGTTHPAARALSAALPDRTVLSVEYFDDDFVEFALYRGGKKRARHIPATYEHLDRHVGRMADFVALLDLNKDQESLLRLIFKETDPDTAVSLIESLLGCPIRLDPDRPQPTAAAQSPAWLAEYAARKRQRVKNQTRLTLLYEGDVGLDRWHLRYPFSLPTCPDPAALWGVDDQGALCPAAEALDSGLWMSRSVVLDGFHGDTWAPPGTAPDEDLLQYQVTGWHTLQAIDLRQGEAVAQLKLPENEILQLLCPLPGVGVVVLLGESTLEVYDRSLRLISRHRVKGWTAGALPRQDGAVTILTYRQNAGTSRQGWLRIYRLGK